MGWFSWLNRKKAEEPPKPPEPLVLGARLRCRYGSHDSFLHLEKESIDINTLPGACVDDCIALENILSFGNCHVGHLCEFKMEIEGKWENPEPQKTMVNGKEIITTKSILKCRESAEEFEIIKSGQDGIYAKHILLIREMQNRYPGLLEILQDSYGSLYLQEGMYEEGLRFLEDRMKAHGGEVEINSMYADGNLEGHLMLASMERLLVDCNTKAFEVFMEDLTDTACQNKMGNKAEWDQNYLNATMLELFKKDCKETAKKMETDPISRAIEKHKMFGSWFAESTNAMAYSILLYYSGTSEVRNRKGKSTEEESNIGVAKRQDNAAGTKGDKINNKGSGEVGIGAKGSGKLFSNGKLDVNNVESLKQTFKGKTTNEIVDILRSEGYDVTIKNSTRSTSGAQIITINNKGEGRNITQVQVSPGGGRHGESPYVKISTDSGKIKVIDGPQSTYKTDGTEKAINIFTEGD